MKLDSPGPITWYVNSRAMIEPLFRRREADPAPSQRQAFGFRSGPQLPCDDGHGFADGFAPLSGSEEETGAAGEAVIVVPTDFSPASLKAARVGASIAGHTQARLVLCHAIVPRVLPFDPATLRWVTQALRTEATEKMRAVRQLAEEANIAATSVIEEGTPATVIIRTARRAEADLIVLTQREHSPWARLLFGPTTGEQVMRAAECHVVVVRADSE